MPIEDLPTFFDSIYPKANLSQVLYKVSGMWDMIESNENIYRPQNLENKVLNFKEEYFLSFKRALEYYPKKDKFFIGFYNCINFNAEAFENKETKVIIVDELLISFYLEIILALYHLTYSTLDFTLKNKCINFINFKFWEFHFRLNSDKNKFNSFSDYFSEIAHLNYQFLFESAVAQNTMLYFIYGHELGHFYHNHPSKNKIFLSKNKYDLNYEFEADLFSYNLVLNISREIRDNDNTNISNHFDRMPLLMFDILDIYYSKIINSNNYLDHPSPADRKNTLLKYFTASLSFEGLKLYEDLNETLGSIEFHPIN